MCDLTRYSAVDRPLIWLDAVTRVAGHVPKATSVNKSDLRGETPIRYDEYAVRNFAESVHGGSYVTSAKTGETEAICSALAADVVAWARERARTPPPLA